MKQAAKATALVLAISLLSGCSSSPKPVETPQAKSKCDEVKKIYEDFSGVLQKEQPTETYRKLYLTRAYYLLENPQCFTSVQIAAAKAEIIMGTR
jgi:uncharacterized lipoprotein